jgi:DNA polymerase III epsilon subunit-like protein
MSKIKTGLPTLGICIDWETSGYKAPREMQGHFIGYADEHQGIALGAVVFDVQTFDVVDTFYVEIKFDENKYLWSSEAEKIHGISRSYLEEYGLSSEEAAVKFVNFLLSHFVPDEELLVMGHNKDFDIAFLHQFLEPFEIMPKIWYRGINTCDIGIVCFGLAKSDQIFDHIGLPPRQDHNALEDAIYTVEVCRTVRTIIKEIGL